MLARVGQQVRDDLAELTGIPEHHDGLVGHAHVHRVVLGGGAGVHHGLQGDLAEVHLVLDLRSSVVEPGQEQQVLHERGHPGGLHLEPVHGLLAALAEVLGQPQHLGVAADRGQRRAQLVGGVRDETAHPVLAALAHLDRLLHVVQQEVQSPADVPHLGPRGRVLDGHATVDAHGPAAQRCAGHIGGEIGDAFERAQGATDDE